MCPCFARAIVRSPYALSARSVDIRRRPASDILSQFAPAFHGFYRAIISAPFAWSLDEWAAVAAALNTLFSPEVVAGLNHLLLDVLRREEDDPEGVLFVRTFLSRYIARARPLSGYFILCCVIEAQWTILAQALAPGARHADVPFAEAAACNHAWKCLLEGAVAEALTGSEAYRDALAKTLESAMKCFTNLLMQIEEMDAEPSEDSYAWETMSESLVRRLWARDISSPG